MYIRNLSYCKVSINCYHSVNDRTYKSTYIVVIVFLQNSNMPTHIMNIKNR